MKSVMAIVVLATTPASDTAAAVMESGFITWFGDEIWQVRWRSGVQIEAISMPFDGKALQSIAQSVVLVAMLPSLKTCIFDILGSDAGKGIEAEMFRQGLARTDQRKDPETKWERGKHPPRIPESP